MVRGANLVGRRVGRQSEHGVRIEGLVVGRIRGTRPLQPPLLLLAPALFCFGGKPQHLVTARLLAALLLCLLFGFALRLFGL